MSTAASSIAAEKYVSLTTYRRNGESSAVPVWIADLGDNELGFTTGPTSLKAKRIRHDGRVHLQACNSRGKLTDGSTRVDGTARVVEVADAAGIDAVRARIKAKYRIGYRIINLMSAIGARLGRGESAQCAIIISVG